MKRAIFFGAFFFIFLFSFSSPKADSVFHPFGGQSTQWLFIDDDGGSYGSGGGLGLSYFLNFNGVNQSSKGTLLVYDGVGVDDGVGDNDFEGGSGIGVFTGLPTVLDGVDFLSAYSVDPLVPVTYTASNENILIRQFAYSTAQLGDDFVVLEYRVVNNNSFSIPVKIALANDFDVDQKSIDVQAGFDELASLVFIQDGVPRDPDFTSAGVSLAAGTFDDFRLNIVGDPNNPSFTDPGEDEARTAYFDGEEGSGGDLTGGQKQTDYEVTLSADLGTLKPAGEASAVFCVVAATGNGLADSFSNIAQLADLCAQFYEEEVRICGNGISNFGEICDDANTESADGCSADCLSDETCGNLYVDAPVGEACDDGNTQGGDGCSADCSKVEICGDGFLDEGEACDDGNTNDDDGCSSLCVADPNFSLMTPSIIEGSGGGKGCQLVMGAVSGSGFLELFALLFSAFTFFRFKRRKGHS